MRFLCCYQIRDEKDELVKKIEVLNTRADSVPEGQSALLTMLSTKYNLKSHFIEKGDETTGVFYIRRMKTYCPTELCDPMNNDDTDEWAE